MNQYKSTAELKRLAKGQLLGKYVTVICAYLMLGCIVLSIMMLYFLLSVNQQPVIGTIFDYAIEFLMNIFLGIFMVGLSHLFLNIACDRPFQPSDIIYCFRNHADKAITIRFILVTVFYLTMAPFYFLSWYFRQNPSGGVYLASCLALIAACVINIYIDLTYGQWMYIMLDFPDYSAKETLLLSKQYMKGNRGRKLYLSITFLPLIFLSLLSCGIAFLWLIPYMQATYTNYYLDLVKQQSPNAGASNYTPTQTSFEAQA